MAEPQTEDLKTVVLNDEHVKLGGRMVPFSGYSLPVQYPTGIIAEHKWTREHAGLFDVSHMGPSFLLLDQKSGDAQKDHETIAALVEPLVCGDIKGLKPGQIRYTLLLNEAGGALDDLMLARPADPAWAGTLYVIVNAGTKQGDWSRIAAAAGGQAKLNRADNCGLLALQGPEAVAIADRLVPGVQDLGFMTYGSFSWGGTQLVISRSGYTGEDGVEILVEPEYATQLWNALLADPRVKPIGLGARDSLRLEAGLPLYGHDLDETVSPTEAGLNFAISKRRREAADFPGAPRILKEFAGDLGRVRVGLFVEGAPAREGAEILDASGAAIGRVTSGGFAPSLNRAIALGFVPAASSSPGTKLQVSVRGRLQPAEVTPLPFVPHRYVRKATP
ncbi:MAG: glycine cleavage system aminomethyltransferase GcvT [Devosia nanyangense]|uniref:aminomethyltransferase n=1 Tax=Devosia nanyangense TaxID=1228055 RepID=A0A933L2P2_9HYPH|nr:glycine cleavage system aminomethyltransferase GcvT [Devosia nanyangense]